LVGLFALLVGCGDSASDSDVGGGDVGGGAVGGGDVGGSATLTIEPCAVVELEKDATLMIAFPGTPTT
jgi:hypothetical protein